MDSQGLPEPTLCPSDPGPRSLLCPVEQEGGVDAVGCAQLVSSIRT